MDKGMHLPFPKKGYLGIAQNYRGIILTSIAAKIYNALYATALNRKLRKYLGRNKMAFG